MLTSRLSCSLFAFNLAIFYLWRRRRRRAAAPDGKQFCTVVVSGAASGLGRRACLAFAARGDNIIALDQDTAGLLSLRQETKMYGVQCAVHTCDVSIWDSVQKTVQTHYNKPDMIIDAIINFAGVIRGGPLVEMSPADIALTMNVSVLGSVHVTKAFFPYLHSHASAKFPAKIIVVASELSASWVSAGFNGPYSMSKFALEAYAVALRQEMRLLGDARLSPSVRVVVINPGAMKTPLLDNQMAGGSNAFFVRHAQREQGTLWKVPLTKASAVAINYMVRHGKDPCLVADTVVQIVHCRIPKDRYLIGASLEMQIAKFVPQWLLDAAIAFRFR